MGDPSNYSSSSILATTAHVDADATADTATQNVADAVTVTTARTNLQRGTALGAASLALVILAKSLTLPHETGRRDALGCDSTCVGSLSSARSALTLLGATVMGQWSDYESCAYYSSYSYNATTTTNDSKGLAKSSSTSSTSQWGQRIAVLAAGQQRHRKKICLWMGVSAVGASIVVANRADRAAHLWLSVVPTAFFQQNMSISKALLGEYQESIPGGTTPGERASSAGVLGASAGLAMMIGPLLGARLWPTPDQATQVAMLLLAVAATLIGWLPNATTAATRTRTSTSTSLKMHHQPNTTTNKQQKFENKNQNNNSNFPSSLFFFFYYLLDIPSARSPAALYLLACRLLSALAYQIFHTVWTVYMKEVLQFEPLDYGRFYSMSGLFFCLSQGFLAKYCLNAVLGSKSGNGSKTSSSSSRSGRVRLLVLATVLLAVLRCLTFCTVHIGALYLICFLSITLWGIISTILAADAVQVAPASELGGFFGLQTAVESLARMMGPLLGAGLAHWVHPTVAPLAAVVGLNLTVAAMVWLGYDQVVLRAGKQQQHKKRGSRDRPQPFVDHKIKQC